MSKLLFGFDVKLRGTEDRYVCPTRQTCCLSVCLSLRETLIKVKVCCTCISFTAPVS